MNTKNQFIVFFIIFLLIYATINSYVVFRLGSLLGVEQKLLYPWILLATFSLPVAMYIERIFPNILSRIIYTLSTLWAGILIFTLCALLIYEPIRLFYVIPYAGVMIVIVVSTLSIISIINATRIVVKEVEIPVENLKRNVTITLLSDIHMGTIRNSGFLKKIIEKVVPLNPDMIMITGDMVDASARLHKNMFSDFNQFKLPIYFVAGNHEIYEELDKVYALFNDTDIKVLRNEVVDSNGLQVIGIEFLEKKGHLRQTLEKLKICPEKPTILLYHAPQDIEAARRAGIDLYLAGHTHAGQIFPFNLLVRISFKYLKGLYNFEKMFLYVSPGTGTWGPYMRFGSKNEITLLKLIPKQH